MPLTPRWRQCNARLQHHAYNHSSIHRATSTLLPPLYSSRYSTQNWHHNHQNITYNIIQLRVVRVNNLISYHICVISLTLLSCWLETHVSTFSQHVKIYNHNKTPLHIHSIHYELQDICKSSIITIRCVNARVSWDYFERNFHVQFQALYRSHLHVYQLHNKIECMVRHYIYVTIVLAPVHRCQFHDYKL